MKYSESEARRQRLIAKYSEGRAARSASDGIAEATERYNLNLRRKGASRAHHDNIQASGFSFCGKYFAFF